MASGAAAKYVDTNEQEKVATQSKDTMANKVENLEVKAEAVKSPLKVEVGSSDDLHNEQNRPQAPTWAWILVEFLMVACAGASLGFGVYSGAKSGDGWADGQWKFALFGFFTGLIMFGVALANQLRCFGKCTKQFRKGCGFFHGPRVFMTLFFLTGGVTFLINALSQKDEGCVRTFCPDHVLDVQHCPAFTWNKHCAKKDVEEAYTAAEDEDCAGKAMAACDGSCQWVSVVCAKPVLDPDQNGLRIVSRITGITMGLFFVGWLLSSWESFRYSWGTSTTAHTLAYMSVFGWAIMSVCRWLVPVPEEVQRSSYKWTWHQYQPLQKIFSRAVMITLLFFMFFVIMGGIVVAAYADLSRASLFGSGGSPALAIVLYVIFANVIGVMPLAPGSAIDVMGGFLFTLIFVEYYSWSLPVSWAVTLAIVIALHFMSSCLQYFMGRTKAAQKWMNRVAPPDMLTASETVLKEAGCIKVGIVGQVFMDTMGGLNQGRMNMNFCTQFWSEYASIPNGIALVTFGAILALPMLDQSIAGQWAILADFLPIVLMVATVFQSAGASFGLKQLISSSRQIKEYWMVTEKWTAAQWFMRRGIYATEQGWGDDVYRLGYGEDCPPEHSLWMKCYAKHAMERQEYDEAQEAIKVDPLGADPVALLVTQRRTEEKLEKIRVEHYEQMMRYLVDARLTAKPGFEDKLIITEPESDSVAFFQYENDRWIWIWGHFFFCAVYIFLFGASYYNLLHAEGVGLDSAVEQGLAVLPSFSDSPMGWPCFILFWVATIFHYHRELLENLNGCLTCCTCCCKNESDGKKMETEFNVPRAVMHAWLEKNEKLLGERLVSANAKAAKQQRPLDT